MNFWKFSFVTILIAATSSFAQASGSPAAWSVSTGVAAPARAAALRLNPAATPGRGNAAQISGRYSTLTGGPISGIEAVWGSSPLAWGVGGEYSMATENPELHAGLGLGFGPHGTGISATARRTASRTRSSFGLSTHSQWSDSVSTGARLDGIGEGKPAMELVVGAAFDAFSRSRLECDLAYGFGSKAFTLRPAAALELPFSLTGAVMVDLPLRSLASYAFGVALGYEGNTYAVQLRASTTLEGGLDLSTRF